MTEPTAPNGDPMLPLPGMDDAPASATALEKAIRRTLTALDADGLVHEVDAGKLQLAIELAQVVGIKKSSGRLSTIGNDARVLMEILNDFKEEAGGFDADLAATMRQWEEAIARADAATAAAGSPEVRDPA